MASVVLNGSVSGSCTITAPSAAGTTTLTLPTQSGTVITTGSTFAGTGPAFSAYAGTGTTVATSTFTKVLFDTEEFDTNNNYASSRFTPTVAGYYQISAGFNSTSGTTGTNNVIGIYKNGTWNKIGSTAVGSTYFTISNLVYLNGSTDYVEIYLFQNSGTNFVTGTNITSNFAGVMVRSA
jgi:hypothetical protein